MPEPSLSGRATGQQVLYRYNSLFTGFPTLAEPRSPIKLRTSGGARSIQLDISVGVFRVETKSDGSRHLVPQNGKTADSLQFLDTQPLVVAIELEEPGRKITSRVDQPRSFQGQIFPAPLVEEPRLRCLFVGPNGGEQPLYLEGLWFRGAGTVNLAELWDKIALTRGEADVVEALKIISPEIEAISIVGGDGPGRMRTAIVKTREFPRPVPLRSFGDGLYRIFAIALSLVNAKGGFLLIDEFENGMHHTVQLEVWRVIFRLSKSLNVQVFATSHSWDAIETFQKAASMNQEDGVLIRLTRKGDAVIPTLFHEKELAIVTREHIEVR